MGAAVIGFLVGCTQAATGEDADDHAEAALQQTSQSTQESEPEVEDSAEPRSDASNDSGAALALPAAAEPESVEIPRIELDEPLIDLAIQQDGRLEPPADWDDVGWFANGSRPGQPGPTVIAAHVDSAAGPAVFFRLLELEPGDEVTVTDAEGDEHLYRVSSTADFPKDDFPTREVFGAGPDDQLRLITCTGEFDDAAGRHLDNRVVFAERED
ncbi:class F sortase [Nesterenkonia salmonea]|uniref:Class F sortase n=2 Tax=Nesterenkonia salmonea TaxID=1804987 RepID=A0A5R9BA19_9MICC|nr:class F sortase [Nesterenkonia salmonea]